MADVLDFSSQAEPVKPLDFSGSAEPLDFSGQAVPSEPEVTDTTRANKRAELVKAMEAERRKGAFAQSIANIASVAESQARALAHPIETTEKGLEAAATLISGSPKVLAVKPSEIISRPLVKIPEIPKQESPTGQVAAGVGNAVIGFANFMQTPEGVAMMGIGALPEAVRRGITLSISAHMAANAPEAFTSAVEAANKGDIQAAAKHATEFIGNTGLSAMAAKHGLAKPEIKAPPLEADFVPEPTSAAAKRVEDRVAFDKPVDERTIGEKVAAVKEKAINLFVDDLRPLERAEREMSGGDLAPGATSPTKLARITTQSSGARAREWATEAMTDFAGNKTGPSLKEIFAKEGIRGDEKNAMLYAVANRAVELHERGINPGIEKADAITTMQELQTPARRQFAAEVRQWNEGAVKYLADAGGISPESLTRMTALNQAYIPFFRVFSEAQRGFGSGGRKIGDTPNVVKGIKGSERQIINPLESMLQHANQIIAVADKVRVARGLVDMAERGDFTHLVKRVPADKVPVQFDIERVRKQLDEAGVKMPEEIDAALTIWRNSPRKPTGENIVTFVRDGKPQYFELHPELYRAVQALDFQRLHPLLDTLFGKGARTIRMGATGIRAGFALITNPVRDFSTMLLQSKGNPVRAAAQWGKHLAKQIGMKDSEIKELWKATGGEIAQPLGLDRRTLQTAVDEVMANSGKRVALNVLKHPVETVRRALSFTEAAPRLAEFEMTLREMGWQPGQRVTPDMAVEAALRAAEVTVNFKRAGAWGRMVNQMVAFFNPAVQGFSKFTRSHQENRVRSVARGLGFITLPAIANWWMNKDDKEWKNLPDWVKYGFLNFKVMDEWVRIPMPFEWWYAYGAMPIASLEAIDSKEPLKLRLAMKEIIEQATPPVIPSVLVPPLEVAMNRSLFTDRPVVPEAQKRLLPQEQALPSTSETAKKIAQILSVGGVEVSPIKVDHILTGETGGLWRDIVGTTERLAGASPQRENLEPADFPIAGRLFIRDNASAVIDEFYTELEHVRQKDATFRKLKKEGSGRADRYKLNRDELRVLAFGSKIERAMTILRQRYRDAESRDERKEIFDRMEKLAERAINADDD